MNKFKVVCIFLLFAFFNCRRTNNPNKVAVEPDQPVYSINNNNTNKKGVNYEHSMKHKGQANQNDIIDSNEKKDDSHSHSKEGKTYEGNDSNSEKYQEASKRFEEKESGEKNKTKEKEYKHKHKNDDEKNKRDKEKGKKNETRNNNQSKPNKSDKKDKKHKNHGNHSNASKRKHNERKDKNSSKDDYHEKEKKSK
jgi:hypothetical protein